MSIGKNIRRLRENHNLTQKEMGIIAGVSDKAVSTWENGIKEPRLGTIQRIADYFGISKSDLMEDIEHPADDRFARTLERFCTAWSRTPERVERDLCLPHGRLWQLLQAEDQPTAAEQALFEQYFQAPDTMSNDLVARSLVLRDQASPLLGETSNLVPLPEFYRKSRRIPVLGHVPAGLPIEAVTDVVDEIDLSGRLADSRYDYFGLLVRGDSMIPEYRDGDVVIIRVQMTAETGDDVVAYIGRDNATLKRLTLTDTGIRLHPLNPAYPVRSFSRAEVETLPVTIAGIVVEQRRSRRR